MINFFEQLVFSFLTGNADMHLKNFSLIKKPDAGWSLCPSWQQLHLPKKLLPGTFDRIIGKPIIVIDTYLCSEGYLVTQVRKETDAMSLITDNGIYFEFVPFTDENVDEDGNIRPGAKALNIGEVEEGVQYVLVISTVAGAWRYMIGDSIEEC